MASFSHLTDDDIRQRIRKLLDILAQHDLVEAALDELIRERDRRFGARGECRSPKRSWRNAGDSA